MKKVKPDQSRAFVLKLLAYIRPSIFVLHQLVIGMTDNQIVWLF